MKNFIKENLVLVVGLTLPLLLILIFFVSTVIPKVMGTPPQYEVLFTINSYDYQNATDRTLDFVVENRKLMVKEHKAENENINYDVKRLMAYDAKTDVVREIVVDMSKVAATAAAGTVLLHETENMLIDTATVSPDGYSLNGPNYSSGGLMGGLFGVSSRNDDVRLKKGNIAYKIPHAQQHSYYNQVQFIGWVIKK